MSKLVHQKLARSSVRDLLFECKLGEGQGVGVLVDVRVIVVSGPITVE